VWAQLTVHLTGKCVHTPAAQAAGRDPATQAAAPGPGGAGAPDYNADTLPSSIAAASRCETLDGPTG
jgi:hypothetical protein